MQQSSVRFPRFGLYLALFALSALALAGQQSAQKPATPDSSNPFPEETGNVPVLPSTPAALETSGGMPGGEAAATSLPLPDADSDPVRTPDDGLPEVDAAAPASGFSSSHTGLDSLLPDPNAPDPADKGKGRRRRSEQEQAPHQETLQEDLTIAKYYLDNKNWKAALSRYQSALVFTAENPDIYWGLAESQRHLGDFASARANYEKVLEYDPDSRHARESAKLLKTGELANAKPAVP